MPPINPPSHPCVFICIFIQRLVLKTSRMYNVFGSGAHHANYAQFIAQTSSYNNGRAIGLLRGAGTRMATWFYAMHRMLRLHVPLKATIHQVQFAELPHTDRAKAAIADIEDSVFWKSIYVLLRAVFPALRLLRFCDSNVPTMDSIFFLSHRTSLAIAASAEDLNDVGLFGGFEKDDELEFEEREIFGEVEIEEADNVVVEDAADESG